MILFHPQSNEVGGSSKMELEGFIRAVNLFQSVDLNIKKIVTDRHS
jgi:hypothetical protein